LRRVRCRTCGAARPGEPEYGETTIAEHVGTTGLDHPKRMFDLTEGLIARGYGDADIKMILGGNAVRVLGKIWSRD